MEEGGGGDDIGEEEMGKGVRACDGVGIWRREQKGKGVGGEDREGKGLFLDRVRFGSAY